MFCDIGDNTPRRLDSPINVQCKTCGTQYTVRLFPLRAECGMTELREFLESADSNKRGLGDVVADMIDTITFGLLKPTAGCGCEQRKEMLNSWWSWKSGR
jgi:hypothetical protein